MFFIEPDIPGYHRKITGNLHTIINTLGREKLHIKVSRICVSEHVLENDNESHFSDSRNGVTPKQTIEIVDNYNIDSRSGRDYDYDYHNRRYRDSERERRDKRLST